MIYKMYSDIKGNKDNMHKTRRWKSENLKSGGHTCPPKRRH